MKFSSAARHVEVSYPIEEMGRTWGQVACFEALYLSPVFIMAKELMLNFLKTGRGSCVLW